jgi:hypothetical protein
MVTLWLRFTRGRPEKTEIYAKCRRGIPEKVEVCARLSKCVLGGYEVTKISLRLFRISRGVSKMPEVCPRCALGGFEMVEKSPRCLMSSQGGCGVYKMCLRWLFTCSKLAMTNVYPRLLRCSGGS